MPVRVKKEEEKSLFLVFFGKMFFIWKVVGTPLESGELHDQSNVKLQAENFIQLEL